MAVRKVSTKLKSTIKRTLAILMKRDNLSRDALASVLDVDPKTVNKWQIGTSAPGLITIISIADTFNVSTDFLVGRSKDPTPPPLTENAGELKEVIGVRLTKLMESDEVTQYRVGKEINLTESAIGKIRKGHRLTMPDTLIDIADYFDVSTDYLLGRTESL